jgi:hypothetical protein
MCTHRVFGVDGHLPHIGATHRRIRPSVQILHGAMHGQFMFRAGVCGGKKLHAQMHVCCAIIQFIA